MPIGMPRSKRRRKRGFRWVRHAPLLAYVKEKLIEKWSPEQIAGRLTLDHATIEQMRVSHTSIYRWIKADRREGGGMVEAPATEPQEAEKALWLGPSPQPHPQSCEHSRAAGKS